MTTHLGRSILGSGERILLVRLGAIGDIVFSSPLVAAFRRAYPRARIAWMVRPDCASLLEHHPDLDELILWPGDDWQRLWQGRQWRALIAAIRDFRARLRGKGFDVAVDLQGLLKSGFLTWLSGARERIGLGSREGSQAFMTRRIPRGGEIKRIGSEYRFLAENLGLPVDDFAMAIHPGPGDLTFAADLIRGQGLGEGYAVLCPFTTRPQKHWFEDRWAALAGRIQEGLGLPVLLLGGPADREAAARIRAQAGPDLRDLTGRTSLLQAAALIQRSQLVIGVDTGLGHMGIAFGRPSLLLFGSTCPYLETGQANAKVLYHSRPCSPCKRRPTCHGAYDCMRDIGVDEVTRAARVLLEATP